MLKRKTSLKRTPFRRKFNTKEDKYDKSAMVNLFQNIWDNMFLPRKCFETNVTLPSQPNTMMFHHVLPKSKYPQYALEEWNIVVLHPDVHATLELNEDKAPKVKAYKEQLFQKLKQDGYI